MIEWKVNFENTDLLQESVTTFDYWTAANSFMEQYDNYWEIYTSKIEACRNKVSIKKLIDYIFIETENVFKGTTHENDWCIYYDELTMFSSATSLQYM